MSTTTVECGTLPTVRPGLLQRFARSVVFRALGAIRRGRLIVTDSLGTEAFAGPAAGPEVAITVRDPAFYGKMLRGGVNAVDDAYLDGGWDCDNLTALFRLFIQSPDSADQLSTNRWSWLSRLRERRAHLRRSNTRGGSQSNIRSHYDLGNDFFRLWLDETMAYSSGVFPTFDATLREASLEKFDRVCRKLDLQPTDHVLEIGSGWGGFAIHAATRYGCRVTTATISQEQYRVACERIEAHGLRDRVEVLCCDYRDLPGQYDKLVSIEMVEAVGDEFLDDYFRQCGRLLRPHGSFVIQAIVMPERRYPQYRRSVDFIQRHVFPGGFLPSVSAILESIGRTSDLRLSHLEDFSPHYAETLRRWRSTFLERLAEVRALGYPERFIRLWDYYLCYCEAVFAEREVGVVQIQFDKAECPADPLQIGGRAASRPLDPAPRMPVPSAVSPGETRSVT